MRRVIFAVFGCLLLTSCSNEQSLPNDVQAEYVAHQVVKAQLIDPDNAEFEASNSKMATFKDSSFVFNGIVKASNRIGIKVPMRYNVGIKWKGGVWQSDTSWTIKFVHIE